MNFRDIFLCDRRGLLLATVIQHRFGVFQCVPVCSKACGSLCGQKCFETNKVVIMNLVGRISKHFLTLRSGLNLRIYLKKQHSLLNC